MQWMVALLLLASFGRALASETPVSTDELERSDTTRAYEQAVRRFNTNIKTFASWDDFKAEVFLRLPPEASGSCYESTGSPMNPVKITQTTFQSPEDNDWQATSGKGWRQYKEDRTFVEYRLNEKTNTLLRVDGVKPRFFFAITKRLCEFPLQKR
jgi:hypothetical protein